MPLYHINIMGGDIESFVNNMLKPYIYAAIEDERKRNDSYDPYPISEYMNYDSVTTKVKKGVVKPKLKNILTISANTKEVFGIIFGKFIEELKDIDVNNTDTLATISEKLTEETFGLFMIDLINNFKDSIGTNLKRVSDKDSFLNAHVGQLLPEKNSEKVAVANIAAIFEDFMKVYCTLLARKVWYLAGITVSPAYVIGDFAMLGMPQMMCDDIRDNIRKKEPVKKTSLLEPAIPSEVTADAPEPAPAPAAKINPEDATAGVNSYLDTLSL